MTIFAEREPCHDSACSGHDEVARLMRGMGPLFENRTDPDDVVAAFVKFLGNWKTKINQALCQEWREDNPCTAQRLLPMHAREWAFPVDCVPLTQEAICEWIALVQRCPPGSMGFVREALAFVLPDKDLTLEWRPVDGKPDWQASRLSACDNCLIITAAPECFSFVEDCRDVFGHVQDGTHPERRYFIREVECLRAAALPIGLSIGYRTDPPGPLGEEIWDVPGTPLCPAPPRPIPQFCCEKEPRCL